MRVFVVFCMLSVPAAAQWLNYKTPGIPRLPDGKPNLCAPAPKIADGRPDLAGVWAAECAIYDGNPCFTRSLFFDLARDLKPSDVETTPWAAAVSGQREGREHVDDPYGFCMPPGIPRIDFGGGPFKILQTPGVTAFLYETLVGMIFRQVFTDGRPLPDAVGEPTWLGYSVGRWDNDAFVVDTNGFREGGWIDTKKARPNSDALRVTERFRRTDFGHMELTIMINDPKAYLKPWTVHTTLILHPDTDLLEAFCDDHDKTIRTAVSGRVARAAQQMTILTRREILAAAVSSGTVWAESRRARPNIVFILADDMGYSDLSCYGRREYKTSNIDSIALHGVRFRQAYANSAVCSATRTALITGRYQYRLRVGLEEPVGFRSPYGLPPEHPTLPSLLKKAGYRTTLIGKWHLGGLPNFGPLKSGYDHFWGFRGGGLDYFTHKSGIANTDTDDLWDDDVKIHQAGYLTDLMGDRAVKAIGNYAKAEQPFLLSLHFNAPHWPWEGPGDEAESRRIKSMMDRDGGSMKTYAEMVTRMDMQVGRVLKAVSGAGIANNTIVVFTSDNGGERFSDTWPFTGKKTDLLEGGLRIPALMRWPGHIRAGSTTEQVGITMDWMPTLLAAAGAEPDPAFPLDGMNLLPQLMQRAATVSRRLYWRYHFNSQRAMRDGDMKYLKIAGNEFLFNVADDPLERANLKERQPDVFRQMVQNYEEWNTAMLPDRTDVNSGPLGYADELADHAGVQRK